MKKDGCLFIMLILPCYMFLNFTNATFGSDQYHGRQYIFKHTLYVHVTTILWIIIFTMINDVMFCFWSLTDSITFNHIANIIKKYKKYVRIDTTLSFFLIKLSEFSFSLVYPKLFGHRKGSKGVFTASDTQISILLLMSILKNDKTVTVLLKGT